MGAWREKSGEGGRRGGGDLRDNVNALPCARFVTVFVFRAAGEICDPCALEIHGVRTFIVVDLSSRPRDGPIAITGIAGWPDADSDVHWCLWVTGSSVRVRVVECADDGAVNVPFE